MKSLALFFAALMTTDTQTELNTTPGRNSAGLPRHQGLHGAHGVNGY
jgi:hypothetical protein